MYRRRLIYECEHWDAPDSSPASFASPPPPSPPSSVNRLLLSKSLSAVITLLSAAFLLGVFYVTMARWYQRRNSSRRAMHLQPPPPPALDRFLDDPEQINYVWYINTVGLDEALINSITKCRYKKGEGLIEEKDCAVCLSEFQEGEDLRFLPKCSHAFHLECIDKWLRAHVNCPLCRAPVAVNPSNFIPAENSDGASSTVAEPRVVDIESNGAQGGSALGAIGDADRGREMLAIDSCVGESNREFPSADKRVEGSPSKFQPFRRSVSMDSPARIQVSMSFGANSSSEFSSLALRRMTTTESCEKSIPAELSSLRGVDLESGEEKSELQDLGDADNQSRPQDMKRSFSIGNNFFFPKHAHNRR